MRARSCPNRWSPSRLLDALAEIANSGQVVSAPAPLRFDLPPLQDNVFDAAVLEELSGLGMGEEFERGPSRSACAMRRAAWKCSRRPAMRAVGTRCATTRTR